MVLLLVLIVRSGRRLAACWRDLVTGTGYQPGDDELPADYGLNPERPWERRQRRSALARSRD